MTQRVWRMLAEVIQPDRASGEQDLFAQLAGAVAELNLPPPFLERIQTAVAEAIRRAGQHDKQPAAQVTVAAHVLSVEGGRAAQSWGFFLIEKRLEQTTGRRIEVLLYPEAR